MSLDSAFKVFLKTIRPDNEADYQEARADLESKIAEDKLLSSVKVSTFLQGSYRRKTATKPENGQRSDIDLVLVTNISEEGGNNTPQAVFAKYVVPFLNKYYPDSYEPQGRSYKIIFPEVELDFVLTSAPSEISKSAVTSPDVVGDVGPEEDQDFAQTFKSALSNAEDWRQYALRIPNRDAKAWEDTNPLAQIKWTWDKNANTNKHYVNVVKCIKWWKRLNYPMPKHPKGYPLEFLVGLHCPKGISSVAQGVAESLEGIVATYKSYVDSGTVPVLPDHGAATLNVFQRVEPEEFKMFYEQVVEAAKAAREALDCAESDQVESTKLWRKLFGDSFPDIGQEIETEKSGAPYVFTPQPLHSVGTSNDE